MTQSGAKLRFVALCLAGLSALWVTASCKQGAASDTNPRAEAPGAPSARTGAVAGVKYTCPMHPDVISDQAGRCPQCKMDLVALPKTQAGTTP